MTLIECTVSGNTAGGGRRGCSTTRRLTLTACTVSGNTAGGGGGGLYEGAAGSDRATLGDTIVAGNTGTGGSASDIGGAGCRERHRHLQPDRDGRLGRDQRTAPAATSS